MKIGEEDLAIAQLRPFAGLGFLDLHDHVGGGKNFGRGAGDDGAGFAVDVVGCSDAFTRVGLDGDAVARSDIFSHGTGGEADAIFVDFDFLWNSDAHRWALPSLKLRSQSTRDSGLKPCDFGALIRRIAENRLDFRTLRRN